MIKNNYHHQFQKKNNFIERLEFEPTIKALYKSFLNSILVCDNAFSCLHPRGFIFFLQKLFGAISFHFSIDYNSDFYVANTKMTALGE